jgi:phage shock protein A
MPDETSARLWDLRAQCEDMLRALSTAQQYLEGYRDGQANALAQLRDQVQVLRRDIDDIVAVLQEMEAHVAELPAIMPKSTER